MTLRSITPIKLEDEEMGKQIRKLFQTFDNVTWPFRDVNSKKYRFLQKRK